MSEHLTYHMVRLSVCMLTMMALCRCAVVNVGLKVGIEKLQLHITQPHVERFS